MRCHLPLFLSEWHTRSVRLSRYATTFKNFFFSDLGVRARSLSSRRKWNSSEPESEPCSFASGHFGLHTPTESSDFWLRPSTSIGRFGRLGLKATCRFRWPRNWWPDKSTGKPWIFWDQLWLSIENKVKFCLIIRIKVYLRKLKSLKRSSTFENDCCSISLTRRLLK